MNTTTSLATFARLPEDILRAVFSHYLYQEDQFMDGIEGDVSRHSGPFARRSTTFATAVLLSCRRFYLIGIGVLWRCLVIRSKKALESVRDQARDGSLSMSDHVLPSITRRLELRLAEAYEQETLAELLQYIKDLNILVIRCQAPVTPPSIVPSSRALLHIICSTTPRLRRLQLESEDGAPSSRDILTVLNSKVYLQTLRVSHFNLHDAQPAQPPTIVTASSLTLLSLGSPLWRPPLTQLNPLDDVLASLSSSPHGLQAMVHLELYELTANCIPFLASHGSHIRRLLCTAPFSGDNNAGSRWIDHCPDLLHLDWVITGSYAEEPPLEHRNVEKVTVVYLKDALENPWACINTMEDALVIFRGGGYPRLSLIEIVVRGHRIPLPEHFDWLGTDVELQRVRTLVLDGEDGWTVTIAA